MTSSTKPLSLETNLMDKGKIELFPISKKKVNAGEIGFLNFDKSVDVENCTSITVNKMGAGVVIGLSVIGAIALKVLTKGKAKVKLPKINSSFEPFKESELKGVRRYLQGFAENEVVPLTKIKQKPWLRFDSQINGAGCANPLANEVLLNPEILTSKDYYKLVDRTGKCIAAGVDDLWQMTGSRSFLESKIAELGLKNAEILPLTRAERFNVIKSTVAHEVFHCQQFQNMILHPDIGFEKMFKEFLEPFMKTDGIKFKIMEKFCKLSWRSLIKSGKKLDPNSELAKKTMKQYRGLVFAKRNKNESLTYKIYKTLPTEKEAYKFEREFAIANDLLI